MKYYKNTEIAALFHVSEKAVRNWVEATQQGKLTLELFDRNGRPMIANTSKNMQLMEELVAERKKFKNTRGHKVISPKPEFYKLFSQKEIADIILSVDLHSELPIQYSYFNGGASMWAQYIDRLLKEETPNTTKSTIKLLSQSEEFLNDLIGNNRKINIIDLGVGDASPAKGLIQGLLDRGALNKYVGIDLSSDMLRIAEENIKQWFGGEVAFEGHKRDITHEWLRDLMVENSYVSDESVPLNVILLLGGTLSNLRLPGHTLRLINNSMGREDILLYSLKTDTEVSRRYFDFRVGSSERKLGSQLRLIPDLMGIDDSLYDVEQYFDETQKARFTRIKLKVDISIKFQFENNSRTLELLKGKTVLLWRVRHKNTLEVINQFDKGGFDLLHCSTTADKGFLLTISRIKTGQIN